MDEMTREIGSIPHLKIMTLTWNMAGGQVNYENLNKLFRKDEVHHDLYVFASQEAMQSIAMSVMTPDKSQLNNLVLDYFADQLPE